MTPRYKVYAWCLLAAYPAWLTMLAVHELGHVLAAWATGGVVAAVHVPLVGFSYTELSSNPSPCIVAWAGPLVGGLLPAVIGLCVRAWAAGHSTDGRRRIKNVIGASAATFAGFCLIANGAYLAIGGPLGVGDGGDIRRSCSGLAGIPALIVVGAAMMAAGLAAWHVVTRRIGPTTSEPKVPRTRAG